MKNIIKYYGAKTNLLKYILPLIPQHEAYLELFVGGASVLFAKEPAKIETINDIDSELVNLYYVIKTPSEALGLSEMINTTLHSRSQHQEALRLWREKDKTNQSKVVRAWVIWVLSNMSFVAGIGKGFAFEKKGMRTTLDINRKREYYTKHYLKVCKRLENTQIECLDCLKCIDYYDYEKLFIYADPPYVGTECGHYGGYTEEDYKNLLTKLSQIKGKFLLSSFQTDLLNEFKEKFNWNQIEIKQDSPAKSGKNRELGDKGISKIEVLTYNYELTNKQQTFDF